MVTLIARVKAKPGKEALMAEECIKAFNIHVQTPYFKVYKENSAELAEGASQI